MTTVEAFLFISGFGAFCGVFVIGLYWIVYKLCSKIFCAVVDFVISLCKKCKRK